MRKGKENAMSKKNMRPAAVIITCLWLCVAITSCSSNKGTNPSNRPPSLQIVLPQSGTTFTAGATITFVGTANDPEDGILSGSSLVWTSNKDGQIGTGQTVSSTTLSVGTHTVTLTATDSEGLTASSQISITIGQQQVGHTPIAATVGNGYLYYTEDGSTWNTQVIDAAQSFADVWFLGDRTTGWTVGVSGVIYKTGNGGLTWTTQSSGVTGTLRSVAFKNSNVGVAVGDGGIIVRTTNGGTTWSPVSSGKAAQLNRVYFTEGGTAWVGGYQGTLLKSTDDGATWTTPSSNPPSTGVIMDFSFLTECLGWFAGWYVSSGHIVMTTSDCGITWSYQHPSTNDLHGVYFTSSTTGFVAGWGGVFKTSDGGTTWTHIGTTTNMHGIRFANSQTGWAVGESGQILKTTDGGGSWTAQSSGTSYNFGKLWVLRQ